MIDQRLREKLEVLAGERTAPGPSRRNQAVRVKDLEALLQMPPQLQSASVSAAPTMAEHNALVEDIHSVHQRLVAVQEALAALIR